MRLTELGSAVFRWHLALRRTPPLPTLGGTEAAEARRLADAERALGRSPEGCAWLDERTVGDLDLPLVFQSIDRTTTPTGAQALWRWLVAPALRRTVLVDRERRLAALTDPDLRRRVRDALRRTAVTSNAPFLPRLLWEPAPRALPLAGFVALLVALALAGVLTAVFPIALLAVVAVFAINVIVDDWANLRLAQQSHALEVLGETLAAAERVLPQLPPILTAGVAEDLGVVRRLRKRITVLALRDPFEILSMLRAGLLVRLFTLGSCMAIVERERDRLRRLVLWLGELDALVSIASLRAERADTRMPELAEVPPAIDARDLVHPAIEDAVGNDLALAGQSLLVTGSNMSGKSTFLRTLAVNAICAQSIHTTFGSWRASVFRVFAVMRTTDDTATGASTYAVEVAAIGRLVAAAGDALPALLAIDEPFSGTNPTLRVPIVVSVLDYLAAHDVALAATHDLDVAAQVDPRFVRGHFCELDELAGTFDRKLRPGVAPSSNALALLERAGYPAAIVAAVRRMGFAPA
jgi:hypothetical protein